MPTKTSIAGWAIERAQRGATSAMKIARPTDSGVAMTAATAITPSVPAMNGRIPNSGLGVAGRPIVREDVVEREVRCGEDLDARSRR